MTISLLSEHKQPQKDACALQFHDALYSQNMMARSAALQKHPRNYGAVPAQRASSRDAYVYAANPAAVSGLNLMVNPKRPEIASNPAVAVRNTLQDERRQLLADAGSFYLQDLIDNYGRAVDDVLTVSHADDGFFQRSPEQAAQSLITKINTINDPFYQTFDHYGMNLRSNWNHVEGQPMDARRKGAPSLFTLATVQAIRGKAEGEDVSAWQNDAQFGSVVDKAMHNVGDTGQQVSRFIDFVHSPAFTQEQREAVLAKLNDYFRHALRGTPDLTLAELTASPDRLVQALAFEKISFMGFMLGFSTKFGDSSPLKNYGRTATFEDVYDNIKETDAVNRVRGLFATIPEEKSEAIVGDLLKTVEPLRREFKQKNPDY